MKKIICALLITVMLFTLTACGGKSEVTYDDNGNAAITSNWNMYEMTSKLGTTEFKGNKLTNKKPSFHTDDGTTFVFKNNGKEHTGTLSEEDGVYTLKYDDSEKNMYLKINGDKMEIQIEDSEVVMRFEAQ